MQSSAIRSVGSAALYLALAACGAGGQGPSEPSPVAPSDAYVPPGAGSAWETVSPRTAGLDSAAFVAAIDWAGTQKSTAVIVLWRGRIVAERYWQGWSASTDSIIASAGKSMTSTALAILRAQGKVNYDAPVAQYLGGGWSNAPTTEAGITVRHLLTMTSGLNDALQAVVAPGTRFYYNNPAYYQTFGVMAVAGGVSRTASGMTALTRSLFWDRIGMASAHWVPNISGGELGFIARMTARDMARFGLLIEREGRWGDTQVVPASAVAEMLGTATPDNPSYGQLWWLNGKGSYRTPGPYLLPTIPAMLIPSAPGDLTAALGAGDKKIYVIPSRDLVVVRHGQEADVAGGNPLAISNFDEHWWQRLRLAL
jgi:CubicO group peptidase (beta-lactamase class C family)